MQTGERVSKEEGDPVGMMRWDGWDNGTYRKVFGRSAIHPKCRIFLPWELYASSASPAAAASSSSSSRHWGLCAVRWIDQQICLGVELIFQ